MIEKARPIVTLYDFNLQLQDLAVLPASIWAGN